MDLSIWLWIESRPAVMERADRRPEPPCGDAKEEHRPDGHGDCNAGSAPAARPWHLCEASSGAVLISAGFGAWPRLAAGHRRDKAITAPRDRLDQTSVGPTRI